MKYLNKLLGITMALLCTGVVSMTVFADETPGTDFDMSKIMGIFEIEDTQKTEDVDMNVIGETGVVQGVDSQVSKNKITVKTMSTVDLSLIASQTYEVTLFDNGTSVAVQRVPIGGGDISVDGLGDGTYTYKINGATDVLVFEETEGSCTVSNGVGSIKVTAKPVAVLYVIDSTGVSNYEFSQFDGSFSTETLISGFAVQQGMRYKARKNGESDFITIEIPAMATEYTYDMGTKQSNVTTNEKAYTDAELPDDVKSADNPFNNPPTMDKGSVSKTDAGSLIVYFSVAAILLAALLSLKVVINRVLIKRDADD